MSTPTEEDIDELPEADLLAVPEASIPAGWLTEFFGRRAARIYQQDSNELALELSGDSGLHRMIFREQDPRVKRQREEDEARRRAWLASQDFQDYVQRSDRLLARIDEQERAIEKRRKEVEDRAIRLQDGRRVYVEGSNYRDENGKLLTGIERDEADALHRGNPQAPTWQEKKELDDRYAEAERLRQKILRDRQDAERGGDITAANDKLSADEKEFSAQVEARAAQAPTDYGSPDYMAAYGDDYQMSTVPAFTKAAAVPRETIAQATDTETESTTADTKKAPQPFSQGAAPKLS